MNFKGFLSGNFWLVVVFLLRSKIDKFYLAEEVYRNYNKCYE